MWVSETTTHRLGNYTINGIKSLICFSMRMTMQTQGTISKALKIFSVNLSELSVSVVKISNLNSKIYPVQSIIGLMN
jgi:hypothetical protein